MNHCCIDIKHYIFSQLDNAVHTSSTCNPENPPPEDVTSSCPINAPKRRSPSQLHHGRRTRSLRTAATAAAHHSIVPRPIDPRPPNSRVRLPSPNRSLKITVLWSTQPRHSFAGFGPRAPRQAGVEGGSDGARGEVEFGGGDVASRVVERALDYHCEVGGGVSCSVGGGTGVGRWGGGRGGRGR